jgi:hypothetical protein
VKDNIFFARSAYKHRKNFEKGGNLFQTVNKTIHHARPFIEYAANAISSRIEKVFFFCQLFFFLIQCNLEKEIYND